MMNIYGREGEKNRRRGREEEEQEEEEEEGGRGRKREVKKERGRPHAARKIFIRTVQYEERRGKERSAFIGMLGCWDVGERGGRGRGKRKRRGLLVF